jgi:hypothetical protein
VLTTNFRWQKCVTVTQLEQILTTPLVCELLRYDEDQKDGQEISHATSVQNQINEVKSRALRLLGLCICADPSLQTSITLFADEVRDVDLLLKRSFTHPLIKTTTLELLLEQQFCFIPYSVSDDGAFHNVTPGIPLPIVFEELDDRIGLGSFSEVFRVEIDSIFDKHQRRGDILHTLPTCSVQSKDIFESNDCPSFARQRYALVSLTLKGSS